MEHLTSLIASLVTNEIRARRKRLQRSVWLYGLAGLLLLTGYLATIAFFAVYIEGQYGIARPLLLITAATIVPAIALIVGVEIANRKQRQRHKELNAQYLSIAKAALALIPQLVGPRSLTAIAAIGILTAMLNKSTMDKSDDN